MPVKKVIIYIGRRYMEDSRERMNKNNKWHIKMAKIVGSHSRSGWRTAEIDDDDKFNGSKQRWLDINFNFQMFG